LSTELTGHEVEQYYERNIARFLRLGGSGDLAAIHRQVWAPGVVNAEQAFSYVNRLAAEAIRPAVQAPSAHVLDVGCGVGGTSTYLAGQLGVNVTGIANGAVQIELAQQRAARLGMAHRCCFIYADYLSLPELPPAQAAVAVESFVHAEDSARFFQQMATSLVDGGRLVVVDDFLTPAGQQEARAAYWIRRFQQGWHVPSVLSVAQTLELASQAGFKLAVLHDLSGTMRSMTWPRLAGMILASALPVKSAFLDNWRGGSALQVCLKRAWSGYYALVWEKTFKKGG
jgi:SAM-dependent methyltransferase